MGGRGASSLISKGGNKEQTTTGKKSTRKQCGTKKEQGVNLFCRSGANN